MTYLITGLITALRPHQNPMDDEQAEWPYEAQYSADSPEQAALMARTEVDASRDEGWLCSLDVQRCEPVRPRHAHVTASQEQDARECGLWPIRVIEGLP